MIPFTSRPPRATDHPSVNPDPLDSVSLVRRPDGPTKLGDYIFTDEPALSLHIVTFVGATLITITWPYTFEDAVGLSALFDAWTLALNGRECNVPPLNGFDSDPLSTLGTSPDEKYVLADLQVKGSSIFIWAVHYFFELLWHRQEEGSVVYIPASTVASIKEAALRDLDDQQQPFLSDGDVLSGWWTRKVLQQMPWAWSRIVSITNTFNLRGILSKTLLTPGASYISNVAGGVLSCSDILSKLVSFTASAARRSIIEQGTISQMEALFAMHN